MVYISPLEHWRPAVRGGNSKPALPLRVQAAENGWPALQLRGQPVLFSTVFEARMLLRMRQRGRAHNGSPAAGAVAPETVVSQEATRRWRRRRPGLWGGGTEARASCRRRPRLPRDPQQTGVMARRAAQNSAGEKTLQCINSAHKGAASNRHDRSRRAVVGLNSQPVGSIPRRRRARRGPIFRMQAQAFCGTLCSRVPSRPWRAAGKQKYDATILTAPEATQEPSCCTAAAMLQQKDS